MKSKNNNSTPLLTALILIIVGILGLFSSRALDKVKDVLPATGWLRVIDGTGNSPADRNTEAAQKLQSAARTQDLVNSRDGEEVQPGTSVDNLLKDKKIR